MKIEKLDGGTKRLIVFIFLFLFCCFIACFVPMHNDKFNIKQSTHSNSIENYTTTTNNPNISIVDSTGIEVCRFDDKHVLTVRDKYGRVIYSRKVGIKTNKK